MVIILRFLSSFQYKIANKILPKRKPLMSIWKKYANLYHLGFGSRCSLGGSVWQTLVGSYGTSLMVGVCGLVSPTHSRICNEAFVNIRSSPFFLNMLPFYFSCFQIVYPHYICCIIFTLWCVLVAYETCLLAYDYLDCALFMCLTYWSLRTRWCVNRFIGLFSSVKWVKCHQESKHHTSWL